MLSALQPQCKKNTLIVQPELVWLAQVGEHDTEPQMTPFSSVDSDLSCDCEIWFGAHSWTSSSTSSRLPHEAHYLKTFIFTLWLGFPSRSRYSLRIEEGKRSKWMRVQKQNMYYITVMIIMMIVIIFNNGNGSRIWIWEYTYTMYIRKIL